MKMAFTKFYSRDWWSKASLELTIEQEGLYIRCCTFMWESGQPIPGDEKIAAKRLHMNTLQYRKVMNQLIDKGKMVRAQGVIINDRVMEDIFRYREESAERSERAKRGHKNRKPPYTEQEITTQIAELQKRLDALKPSDESCVNPGGNPGATGGVEVDKPLKEKEQKKQVQSTTKASAKQGPARKRRGMKFSAADEALTNEAFELWNRAAEHFGFRACQARTEARRSRLLKRLSDLEDDPIEKMRRALWAVRFDRFLSGETTKGSPDPFRLDIDRFLQTDGQLGDVIARLLDLAADNGSRAVSSSQGLESRLKALTDEQQLELLAEHANGIWPTNVLLYPPCDDRCVIRESVLKIAGINRDTYSQQGFKVK